MAASRVPALRKLLCPQLRSPGTSSQRRWAQVYDVRLRANVRFLATTQAERQVLEKYKDKLDAKAREEGHADINELKKAYAQRIHDLQIKDAAIPTGGAAWKPPASPAAAAVASPHSTTGTAGSTTAHKSWLSFSATSQPRTGIKPLDAILDLSKVRALPLPELTAIWRLRHASNPQTLSAVIPAHTYEAMESAARQTPQFVLPVPHPEHGAEIHFLQWTFDAASQTSTALFTQLAEYKARGEFAAPHTTVTHHLDLKGEKGVVLMQGQVVPDRGVKADDARWLVMCLQRFYGRWGAEGDQASRERAHQRQRLLEWFRNGDSRFSVEKLMEEAERMA